MQLTTGGSISIVFNGSALAIWFEEPHPVGFVGVAQVLVLNDDHISIADFFQGSKAQGGDGEMSHNHATAAAVKKI